MRYLLPIFVLGGVTLAAPLVYAAPRTIKDCEKIAAADAYNQCLASFGPVAHEHKLKPVPPGIGSERLIRRHSRRHRHAAGHIHHGSGKRHRLTITPEKQD